MEKWKQQITKERKLLTLNKIKLVKEKSRVPNIKIPNKLFLTMG